jgi:hypothetical protein
MTARPNFSGGRGRPVVVAVALCIVLVAVVLTAGCGVPFARDIVVVKLAPNGSAEWVSMISTGQDTEADSIIQTKKGNYFIVAASERPVDPGFLGTGPLIVSRTGTYDGTLLRLTNDGSSSSIASSIIERCGRINFIVKDNDLILTLSHNGELCKIDDNGNILWNRSTGLVASTSVSPNENMTYKISGMNITQVPWTVSDFIENHNEEYLKIRLRECANTTPQTNTSCNWGNKTKSTPFTAILNPDGKVVNYSEQQESSIFANKSGQESPGMSLGLTIEFVSEENIQQNIQARPTSWAPYAVKRDAESSVLWKTRIDLSGHPELIGHHWQTEKIIQTSDGGYVILADVDKSRK